MLLVTVQKIFIAPPRIVLFQNSSKFLALHHFDIGTNIEYVSKSTQEHKMALSLRGPRVAIYNYHVIYICNVLCCILYVNCTFLLRLDFRIIFEAKLKRRRRANEVVDPNSGVTIQF